MPVSKPYRRTCRQFSDGHYTEGGRSMYIRHHRFAKSPGQYVRAFLLLSKDVHDLFDYIEPADKNLECYSYRIHALLLRTCVEVEANFRAILIENDYIKGDMTMIDYRKVNVSHRFRRTRSRCQCGAGQRMLDLLSRLGHWACLFHGIRLTILLNITDIPRLNWRHSIICSMRYAAC